MTDRSRFANCLKFESLESRILLSAAPEILAFLPETRQPGASVHFDLSTTPSVSLGRPTTPDAPTSTSEQQSTGQGAIQGRQSLTYGAFSATRPITEREANIFNNAGGSGSNTDTSQPNPVNPDPIPLNKLNSSTWGDWMPSYQSKIRTLEQTQISIGTSLSGHSNTGGTGAIASSTSHSTYSDTGADREKSRIDLSKQPEKATPTAVIKPPHNQKESHSTRERALSKHWQKNFVHNGPTNTTVSLHTRVELAAELPAAIVPAPENRTAA